MSDRARMIAKKIIEQADECKGITDCLNMMTNEIAAALAAERVKVDRGKLWSFCRQLLSQGGDIQMDYTAGKYKSYEEYSARLDSAARERVDEWVQAQAERKG